jgi:hypothetical protein
MFLQFSTNFQNFNKFRRDRFTNRPSNFADRPSEQKFRLQLGPWRHGRWWELNSGEGKARLGRERVGECLGAHLRLICAHRWGREAPGGGLRRWPAVPAAGAPVPVEGRRWWWHPRHGEVVWCRVEMLGRLAGGGWVELLKLAVETPRAVATSACAWQQVASA